MICVSLSQFWTVVLLNQFFLAKMFFFNGPSCFLETGSATADCLISSAVHGKTGQIINTQHKMKCDFLQKFEETKWVQKSPKFDPAPVTLILPPPSSSFSCLRANRSSYQYAAQNEIRFSAKVRGNKVGSKDT